jgi:hypothetical protein
MKKVLSSGRLPFEITRLKAPAWGALDARVQQQVLKIPPLQRQFVDGFVRRRLSTCDSATSAQSLQTGMKLVD